MRPEHVSLLSGRSRQRVSDKSQDAVADITGTPCAHRVPPRRCGAAHECDELALSIKTRVGCVQRALCHHDHFCQEELHDGRLVRLLPDWSKRPGLVHLVFTTKRGLTPAVRALIGHLAFGFNEDDSMESPTEWIRPPNLAGELPAQLHAKRRRSAAIRDAHGCGREIGNRECFNARKQSAKLARHGFSR